MYILAIETTGPKCSAAIIDENGKTVIKSSSRSMNHLKDLIPMSQELIDQLGIEKGELTAVAASIGPGSFTGIRIGVSAARAIAQALNIPAIGVKTLDAFKEQCDGIHMIVPVFNARRGQVYGAIFGEDGEEILRSGPYMLEEVLETVQKNLKERLSDTCCGMPATPAVKFYGDGIDAYGERLEQFKQQLSKDGIGALIKTADIEERYQDAAMIAAVAYRMYEDGQTVTVDRLLPDYMRATEAEQKLKDGSLQRERAAKLARFKAR